VNFLTVFFFFSLIIIVHEFGHYYVAKKTGVKVNSFNIGFGPKIFSKKANGTSYLIRAFLFGGAVELDGLDEAANKQSKSKSNYHNKTWLTRFVIVVAGSLMNIFLAFIIFSSIYVFIGDPVEISSEIASVLKDSPAAEAGLKKGDRLLKIGSLAINTPQDLEKGVKKIHETPLGETVYLEILRGDKRLFKRVATMQHEQQPMAVTGIILKAAKTKKESLWRGFYLGFNDTWKYSLVFFKGLTLLFSRDVLGSVSGPVGIMHLSSQMFQYGTAVYLRFFGMLSIWIGFFNLLPLPALDGGRVGFLMYELLFRRKASINFEKYVHIIGFMLLFALLLVVTYNDLLKIFIMQ
jgi:regulator of sigma E protease